MAKSARHKQKLSIVLFYLRMSSPIPRMVDVVVGFRRRRRRRRGTFTSNETRSMFV